MAEKLTNITAPKYRCTHGHCPAVLDDDSGNFVFIGEKLDPLPEELAGKVSDTEAAVKLSADLVLSSLGVSELVEAVKPFIDFFGEIKDYYKDDDLWMNSYLSFGDGTSKNVRITYGNLRALSSALSKTNGGN